MTPVNNRAVVSIDGVRDKLRVLLVSGEPHAGERTWRNLLKSDASVDLVHFTILRPPEKQDGTPINELSLIAFPTRELFQQKIKEFNLIIFDRYARQGVLPIIYFDNIARYVQEGGAVLVAAGPDYASQTSIWRTPLEQILPAEPSGRTVEMPFHAQLSDAGKRHPVTRGLVGADSSPPHWSRWFRLVDTRAANGTTIMEGPDKKPVLVLSREGEGRVGLLLSDHIWLWARGYEGGGPHLDLMRRLSHWLMKQPDLEEEALRLIVRGRDLLIERQTMADNVGEVTLTLPSGATRTVTLAAGRARAVARLGPRDGAGPLARHRRQAQCSGQCGTAQSARVRRSDFDHRGAGTVCGGDRRRRAAAHRCVGQCGVAAHRRDAVERNLSRRRLAGPEDARRQRGARHRRAADVRRPARPAAAGRRAGRDLGARRPVTRPLRKTPLRSFWAREGRKGAK